MRQSKIIITCIILFEFSFSLCAQKFRITQIDIPSSIHIINDLKIENNTLWLATSSGLYCMENEHLKSFKEDENGNLLKINTIEIDTLGNKWLGTYSGKLIKFNKRKVQSVIGFDKFLTNDNQIITDIDINASEQKILLSTANGTILIYKLRSGTKGIMDSPAKNTMIYSINNVGDKDICLCSADGFYIKSLKGKWKKYQGLYVAYGIFKQSGNYWAIGRNQDKKALLMLYYKYQNLSKEKYVWKEFNLDELPNKYARFYELALAGSYAWICSDIGLICYNTLNGKLSLIDKYQDIDLKRIRHIVLQDEHHLWLSTAGNKLYKLEIKEYE